MKLWIPVAFAVVVVVAYSLFYLLSAHSKEVGSSIGIVNMVGIASVVIGVVAAGFILRRSTPAARVHLHEFRWSPR